MGSPKTISFVGVTEYRLCLMLGGSAPSFPNEPFPMPCGVLTMSSSPDALAGSTLPGEDTFAFPDEWRDQINPRRGGVPGPAVSIDDTAVEVLQRYERDLHDSLQKVTGDPELVGAVKAHLGGNVTPLSAAVIVVLAHAEINKEEDRDDRHRKFRETELFADAWITVGGPKFAAETTAELARVDAEKGRTRYKLLFRNGTDHWNPHRNTIADRVRAFLAVADEDDYRDAIEALEPHRDGLLRRVVVSFLVPTETGWVDELCQELSTVPERTIRYPLWPLVDSVGTAEQLAQLTAYDFGWDRLEWDHTLLAALGTAVLPAYVKAVESGLRPSPGLAAVPSDEAFRLIVANLETDRVHETARAAMRRFPVRALRLLSEGSTGTSKSAVLAARLLHSHVQDNPDLVAAVLPRLDPTVRVAIDKAAERTKLAAEAPADAVPPLLAEPPWTHHGRKQSKDPLYKLPPFIPEVPFNLDFDLLPQVLLRNRQYALPRSAVENLIRMLAISERGKIYAVVEAVKQHLDPASLAALGWELFEFLRDDRRERWTLYALAAVGDDETVRRLTPVIRAWPGEESWPPKWGYEKAEMGLEVLAAIGTDVALLHLHDIATKLKYRETRAKAQEQLAESAAGRGITPEQLADRFVPDFGLDERGSLTLDYGPRCFTVGFDEQLSPYVIDQDGKRRKSLPKPGSRDDQELASAAYQLFAALKKDVRTVAKNRFRHYERAMVEQWHWDSVEFQRLFVRNPLLWHIARRLLWRTDDGRYFRIAEDRTFADVADDAVELAESARIHIAHPVQLPAELDRWREVFGDYEIVQPFAQLDRPVHTLTDDEKAATELKHFSDHTVSTYAVVGLERRGWKPATKLDDGVECWVSRPIPGDREVVVDLDPGIRVGMLDRRPEQRLATIWIAASTDIHRSRGSQITFGELDMVTSSEVLADLTELVRGG
ncbi:DUF4132 domain-containing protein [Saccharopolyspora shandongensis]|uniref:DUF4132 domain-containing protein n=1 Tax=Saccharopolyspora shandongensis TaxID=418495 RepID=UPI00343D1D55